MTIKETKFTKSGEILVKYFKNHPPSIRILVHLAMDEYGKYCAEQAWKANDKEDPDKDYMYFEDWWNEFKAKENETM